MDDQLQQVLERSKAEPQLKQCWDMLTAISDVGERRVALRELRDVVRKSRATSGSHQIDLQNVLQRLLWKHPGAKEFLTAMGYTLMDDQAVRFDRKTHILDAAWDIVKDVNVVSGPAPSSPLGRRNRASGAAIDLTGSPGGRGARVTRQDGSKRQRVPATSDRPQNSSSDLLSVRPLLGAKPASSRSDDARARHEPRGQENTAPQQVHITVRFPATDGRHWENMHLSSERFENVYMEILKKWTRNVDFVITSPSKPGWTHSPDDNGRTLDELGLRNQIRIEVREKRSVVDLTSQSSSTSLTPAMSSMSYGRSARTTRSGATYSRGPFSNVPDVASRSAFRADSDVQFRGTGRNSGPSPRVVRRRRRSLEGLHGLSPLRRGPSRRREQGVPITPPRSRGRANNPPKETPTPIREMRQVRSSQDAEYEAIVAQAKQKEREDAEKAAKLAEEVRLEEEEKARVEAQEEEKRQMQSILASEVPAEPPEGHAGAVTILLRMPDGSRHKRRFLESDQVYGIISFVRSLGELKDKDGNVWDEFELFQTMPPKRYTNVMQTLREAGLRRSAALFVKEKL